MNPIQNILIFSIILILSCLSVRNSRAEEPNTNLRIGYVDVEAGCNFSLSAADNAKAVLFIDSKPDSKNPHKTKDFAHVKLDGVVYELPSVYNKFSILPKRPKNSYLSKSHQIFRRGTIVLDIKYHDIREVESGSAEEGTMEISKGDQSKKLQVFGYCGC